MVNNINNTILLVAFTIFIMFLSYFWYRHTRNTLFINQDSSEGLLAELNPKFLLDEEALWSLIASHTGVTYRDCLRNRQKHLKQETAIYKKSNTRQLKRAKKLSPLTLQTVATVMQDFEINSKSIDIVPYKGKGSPAAADDWTLFIDEDDLLSYPLDAQYFVLGHEMIHIKLKDHSIHCALHRLIPKKNKKIRTALAEFDRFQETRADTFAMLKGDIYTQGCISFLKQLQEREGEDFESPSHPKTADRIALAENIRSLPRLHTPTQLCKI